MDPLRISRSERWSGLAVFSQIRRGAFGKTVENAVDLLRSDERGRGGSTGIDCITKGSIHLRHIDDVASIIDELPHNLMIFYVIHRQSIQSPHSHSIVPGGLLVTSYTTRLTPCTSLMIRVAARPKNAMSNGKKSAVMPSDEVTARSAQTWS